MNFDYSPKVRALQSRLQEFMDGHVYPNEKRFDAEVAEGDRWQPTRVVEELKVEGASRGFVEPVPAESGHGAGLTNTEYAPLCEIMGRVLWASEVFNCSAPDTGNMEVLERYGTPEQKRQWLEPLLDGKIRSAFRDDRARRGVLRRDQHPELDRARRRRLRDQRSQVVVLGRG